MHWIERRANEIDREVAKVARKYRLSPEDAEDLGQEVRIRLMGRDETIPGGYIYRVAVNYASDLKRFRTRRPSTVSVATLPFDLFDRVPGADAFRSSDLAFELEYQLSKVTRDDRQFLCSCAASKALSTSARARLHRLRLRLSGVAA